VATFSLVTWPVSHLSEAILTWEFVVRVGGFQGLIILAPDGAPQHRRRLKPWFLKGFVVTGYRPPPQNRLFRQLQPQHLPDKRGLTRMIKPWGAIKAALTRKEFPYMIFYDSRPWMLTWQKRLTDLQ